jgi:hypothetical protein
METMEEMPEAWLADKYLARPAATKFKELFYPPPPPTESGKPSGGKEREAGPSS